MSYKTLAGLTFLFFVCFYSLAFAQNREIKEKKTHEKLSNENNQNDYEVFWRQIDSLDNLNRTQSAKQVAEDIYQMASSEKNAKQTLKALLVKLSYEKTLDSKNERLIIKEMERGLGLLGFPERNILQAALAGEYWMYYRENYYSFRNRSAIEDDSSSDFETWSLNRIRDEAEKLFFASLEGSEELKRIPVSEYSDFILKGNIYGSKYRPTLYDMLCHDALDCFTNSQFNIDKFDKRFREEPGLLGTAEEFLRAVNLPEGSSLIKDNAVKILRDLTVFHLGDSLKSELVDIDLTRLNYIRMNFLRSPGDSLYLKALNKLAVYYKGSLPLSRVWADLALYYYENPGYWQVSLNNSRWNIKKALGFCDSAIVNFPESYGAKLSESIKSGILGKSLFVQAENAVLPDEPFRISVFCKNLTRVFFRVIEVSSIRSDTSFSNESALVNYYRTLRPYRSFSALFPDLGDYCSHKFDYIFPALPTGKYVIMASADSAFSFSPGLTLYQGIFVTNLSAIINTEDGKIEFYVLDRKSGKPLDEVNIEVSVKNNYNSPEIKSYKTLKTDEDGYADFSPPYSSFHFVFSAGKDSFATDYYKGLYYGNSDEWFSKTFFFFDRKIYRPGQTVFFKGLSFRHKQSTGEYEVEKNSHKTVTLYDPNGRVVSQLELETNEYGSVNGQFELPEKLFTGLWRLNGEAGFFNVEEYKRPQFEVHLDKIKGEYSLNDEIKVTGSVQAYSGALLSRVETQYTVLREQYILYGNWKYLPGYRDGGAEKVAEGRVTSNDKGEFTFTFKALPDPLDKGRETVYNYHIYVVAVDKTGESHRAETGVMAGGVSILADIDIPEVINKNGQQNYTLATKDLSGNLKPAQVSLSVFKLKAPERIFRKSFLGKPDTSLLSMDEFHRLLSHEAYMDEQNSACWEKEKLVLDTSFVTVEKKPFGKNVFSRLEQGKYMLKISAKDINGKPAEIIKYFTLLDPTSGKMPLKDALWFHPLKYEVEPGENLMVSIGTALNNATVLFEVECKGKPIKREWYSLSNEQKLIEIPVKEKYRGYFVVHCYMVWENSMFHSSKYITVPWNNKKLKVELETFRDKITPGETETWKIKVKDHNGNPAEAEVLAAMYDESLDALGDPYKWNLEIYRDYYRNNWWDETVSFSLGNFMSTRRYWEDYSERPWILYNNLYYYELFHAYNETFYGRMYKSRTFPISLLKSSVLKDVVTAPGNKSDMPNSSAAITIVKESPKEEAFTFVGERRMEAGFLLEGVQEAPKKDLLASPFASEDKNMLMNVAARKNFSETAFFYPNLPTNEEGIAEFSFKVPEALTKWKMMVMAHTEDLEFGMLTSSTVTQKKMMVQAFPPRFFREKDTIWYTSRVSNLSDSTITGQARLMGLDGIRRHSIDEALGNINSLREYSLKPKETKVLTWKLTIPEGKFRSVLCRVVAQSGSFSDGEENIIPVLENMVLVTESMPLPLKGNENRSFVFESLRSKQSGSLKNFKLTLEFTSNPAYLAFQALPSLMEYNFESADNIFNSYYATSIAMHIANSNPELKKAFEAWKASGKKVLSSSLEKNQDLKNLLIEETPWYAEAQSETESMARLGELFDFAKLEPQLSKAEEKLRSMQTEKGGWAWFRGMEENIYLTQSIIAGFGHLQKLGISIVTPKNSWSSPVLKAIQRCDEKMYNDYIAAKKRDSTLSGVYAGNEKIQYLYARSFFTKLPLYNIHQEAFNFWKKRALEKWQERGIYMQGMIALMCHRYNDNENAEKIMKSVLDNAVTDKEMGMHFNQKSGYYWYESPIETQALLIEAVDEILHDSKSVDEMKVWLLKNKQTNSWTSPRATAEAVYVLLLRGTDWRNESLMPEIQIGGEKLDVVKSNPEAGTGYVKRSWDAEGISPEMSNVAVTNRNSVPAWGALYWQYFEKLDKLAASGSGLSIKKDLFLKAGNNKLIPVTEALELKAGDELKVRLIIRTDRDMEFVHIKDMRASGLEPVNVLSGCRYQDGLFYYEATKDASANFFMDRIPKGTYVFEYPLKVTYNGTFSDGIAEIQCMYAPEYRSHSSETHLRVK